MKQYSELMKNLSLLSQLGLSLIMPLLLCLFFCYALTKYIGVGQWVYLPGFVFGLGGSFMTAYKFYLSLSRKGKDRREPFGMNRHR